MSSLVKLLGLRFKNICAVGEWTVYLWLAGAAQNILDFENDYKEAKVSP